MSSLSDDNDSYGLSFQNHGESPRSLKWKSYKAAAQRYKQLVADIEIEGRTILDVGCGMGDLLPFLYAKANKFNYQGIDLQLEFIAVAKKRYEGHDFKVGNPFRRDFSTSSDVVLCSGALNSSGENWLDKRKKMIEKLFTIANESVAFNMAGGLYESSENKNIGYASAEDIINFCATLTKKLILRKQYHTNDFTIVLKK